jgi:hypothetical protein
MLGRQLIVETRNVLKRGGGCLGGDHHVGDVGLAAAVLTLAATFFVNFAAAGLGPAIDLG